MGKDRNTVAGEVQQVLVRKLAKKLAYRFGSAAKEGAGLTLSGFIEALKKPQKDYDELRAYLNGADNEGMEPFVGDTTGPSHESLTGTRDAKEYKGIINPENEFVFPGRVRSVIESAADAGSNIYLNADLMPYTGGYRYDAANHPVRITRDKDGNIIGSAADIFDFDVGYIKRYDAPRLQVALMSSVGEPYIIRQDNIPVRFVSDDADMEDLMKASRTMEAWGSAETPHIKKKRGDLPGNIGTYHDKDSETYAIENTLKRAGVAVDDYPTYLQDYRNGGKIHIKPENRGKFTALKKRTGHSASWFKAHGTPAQKKMAVFALNAKKWKHADGGLLHRFDMGGDTQDYNQKLSDYKRAESDYASAKGEWDMAAKARREFIRNYNNDRGYWYWTKEGKKLSSDEKSAKSRLDDAREKLDSLQSVIGAATLDKYSGTPYDPLYFSNFVAENTDKARKYYTERGIRESEAAQDVIDFFNSYGLSDGFNRIRNNQESWWLNRHPYRRLVPFEKGTALRATDWLQDRMAGLNGGTANGIFDLDTYTEMSVMRSGAGRGAITVGTIESPEQPYLFALPHEIAHITNTAGFATSPGSVQAEALEQNTNTDEGHDSRPSEKHSDIEALRYMLFKEGIYDSRGDKDATAEDIKKLRKKYPKIRPLLQMDDEQAAWMINHVADAGEKIDISNIAAYGGLLAVPEKTEYANKWDSISNARYGMANDALTRSGSSKSDADRLARILAAQSALEAGWVDDVKGNNYSGYMSNGKRMSFDTTDAFWDYHIKNLDERWPDWRKAQTVEDYYNTVNNTALGLTTKELFQEYNKNHRDNPAYIYAPDWENENYLKKLQSIYDKYISTYVKPMFDAGGFIQKYGKDKILSVLKKVKQPN